MYVNLDDAKAPQFFNFNNVHEDVNVDAFFEPRFQKKKATEEKRVFKFTAVLGTSKSHAANSKSKSVPGPSLSVKKRQSMRTSAKVVKVPKSKAVKSKQVKSPLKGPAKRSVPFKDTRPMKKMRETIRPVTPECLKRSLQSKKVVKTSEQLEMEHIAVLQNQMVKHLKANKESVKKVLQGSALKPLPPAPRNGQVAKPKKTINNNNVKGAVPGKKALPVKQPSCNKKLVTQPTMSFLLAADFHPPRASTPYGPQKKLNSNCNKPSQKILPKAWTPKLDVPCHSGVSFILKDKKTLLNSLSKSRSQPPEKSFVSILEQSMKTLNLDTLPDSPTVVVKKMSAGELGQYLPASEVEKIQPVACKKLSVLVEKLPYHKLVSKNEPSVCEEMKQQVKKTLKIENKRHNKVVDKKENLPRGIHKQKAVNSPLNDVTSSYRNHLTMNKPMRKNLTDPKKTPTVDLKLKLKSGGTAVENMNPISKCTRSKSNRLGAENLNVKKLQPDPVFAVVKKKF